jgi:hypothetical protein
LIEVNGDERSAHSKHTYDAEPSSPMKGFAMGFKIGQPKNPVLT